ncbi:MAG TPA: alpha-amylase family glycosyl hydrolase, partial [Thermoleophilaceae bacterium]|nr:alpha-amylase family glycosyl hydrolase [Thermoleophilaceae bacterium]
FNFDFLSCAWDRDRLRTSIEEALATHAPVEAPATWVLSNHDVTRPPTRYGRADTSFSFEAKREGTPTDIARGTRRARAAALLAMALPGSLYVYQGEELGLPEVEDIPSELRRDPIWLRSGGADPGRDGCRVPMPWSGTGPPYGFSPEGARRPWLDQPDDWTSLTVEAQTDDPASMLLLYREGLRIRRSRPWGAGPFQWLGPLGTLFGVTSLSFARGDAFSCVVNFGPEPVALPAGAVVLIASNELEGGALPQDTTVWLYQENGGDGPSNWEPTSTS